MTQLLIFNADDYGLSPAVSQGIREARSGVIRSTTVLANLVTGADLDSLIGGQINAGVHLNLSVGKPLTKGFPAEALKSDGSFLKEFALAPLNWQAGLLDSVRLEWEEQLLSLHNRGLRLTHLDSHHHVHLLEPLFPVAVDLARKYNLGIRTRPAQADQARSAGVYTTQSLQEEFFGNGCITKEHLLAILDEETRDIVEVMCHPGLVDAQLRAYSAYLDERRQELDVLGDPKLTAELALRGWRLGDFSQVN